MDVTKGEVGIPNRNTIGDEGKPEKKCFICHEEFDTAY